MICLGALAATSEASVTLFYGGDSGEGLDLSGNYLYAVNVNGPGGYTVQGLKFTGDSTTAGVTFTSPYSTAGAVNIGGAASPTADDVALNNLMTTIRYGSSTTPVVLTYNVIPGKTYRVQLLVDSSAYNGRTQDITVDGVTVADNLILNGPPAVGPGRLITHTYTAASNTTQVLVGPSGMVGGNGVGGDNNAVFNAFTVQQLPDTTVGYWRMEDGAAGATPAAVASMFNNGVMQGTVTGSPVLNADVPGYQIADGLNGPLVGQDKTSIQFQSSGQYVTIPFNALLQPSEFTVEFFMKAGVQGGYPAIVQKRKQAGGTAVGGGNITWGIGKEASNELEFARIDPANTAANQTFTVGSSTADGKWHHFALTYSSGTWTMYQDYTLMAQRTGLLIDYDGLSGLSFGFAPTDFGQYIGLLDEVRFSDMVLSPAQFLQAVPEPSTLVLLLTAGGLALAAFLGRRRAG